MSIPIGLELYSVRNSMEKDMEKTLYEVKRFGYESVEYAGPLDDSSCKRLRAALDNEGLKSTSWHIPFTQLSEERIAETVDICEEIGCSICIIPGVDTKYYQSYDTVMDFCGILNEINNRLKHRGIKLGYHNHMIEFNKLSSGDTIWTTFRKNTSPDIILQYDTGNALHGRADINTELFTLENRLEVIHIKPYSIQYGFEALIGEDDVDYISVFDFCKNKGGTKSYIIEYEGISRYGEMEAVEKCLKNMKLKYGDVI